MESRTWILRVDDAIALAFYVVGARREKEQGWAVRLTDKRSSLECRIRKVYGICEIFILLDAAFCCARATAQ